MPKIRAELLSDERPALTTNALKHGQKTGPTSPVRSHILKHALLKTAREDFPAFYARATAREMQLMNMLVLVTALLLRLKRTLFARVAEEANETLSATEQAFVDLRQQLWKSSTFAALPELERQRIQSVIFRRLP